jgi:hypothetical protein
VKKKQLVNEKSERFIDEGRRHLFATFELHAYEVWCVSP